MNNYPPVLRPAMEIIEAQAKTIEQLNATIASLVERVNRLSSDMGYPELGVAVPQQAQQVQQASATPQPSAASAAAPTPEDTVPTTSADTIRIYCPVPDIAGDGQAFYCDMLTPLKTYFSLDIDKNARTGTFFVTPDKDIRQMGFERDLMPVTDCEEWPADAIDKTIVNIAPGTIKYDASDDMWMVTGKAVIKFE
ncbi:MAG: hypothetical protein OSJ46_00605 [Duncaniella sp.]|nr:hypothetical protein [Duncaniella sp.]HBI57859.1 hypothetical protein [Porphyromonadaceae bacterium]